jgi:hypothetical protein
MSESVSAAITIQGSTLRYAEVKRTDQHHRLLRFGEHGFPFDLGQVLLHEEGKAQQVGQVATVLGEAFADTEAHELRVGVHPLDAYSFFTPISSDVPVRDRKRQLFQQAALVTGARSKNELHMASQTVRTTQDSDGEPFMWVHVLAVPEVVDERMSELIGTLPVARYDWIASSEAVGRVTSRLERTGGSAQEALRPYTLTVGQYPSHTEYALTRNREWYHAHYAEEADSPENRAYFAVGFMNRVGVSLDAVGRLYVYGQDVDVAEYGPFVSIFDRAPEVLDPFRVVQSRTDPSETEGAAYAACIGAGMDEYVG